MKMSPRSSPQGRSYGSFTPALSHPALLLSARLAITAPFLVSGVAKLLDFPATVGEVRGLTGLEPAAVIAAAVILLQLAGSLAILAGRRLAAPGALALAAFTALATLYAHAFWAKPVAEQFLHRNIFFEHVALIGGLLAVAVLAGRSRPAEAAG